MFHGRCAINLSESWHRRMSWLDLIMSNDQQIACGPLESGEVALCSDTIARYSNMLPRKLKAVSSWPFRTFQCDSWWICCRRGLWRNCATGWFCLFCLFCAVSNCVTAWSVRLWCSKAATTGGKLFCWRLLAARSWDMVDVEPSIVGAKWPARSKIWGWHHGHPMGIPWASALSHDVWKWYQRGFMTRPARCAKVMQDGRWEAQSEGLPGLPGLPFRFDRVVLPGVLRCACGAWAA